MTIGILKNNLIIITSLGLLIVLTLFGACFENRQYVKEIEVDFRANKADFEKAASVVRQLSDQGDTLKGITLKKDTIVLSHYGKQDKNYVLSNNRLISTDDGSVLKDTNTLFLAKFIQKHKVYSLFSCHPTKDSVRVEDIVGMLLEPYFPTIYMHRMCDTCRYSNYKLQLFSEFDNGDASWVYMIDSLWYLESYRHF